MNALKYAWLDNKINKISLIIGGIVVIEQGLLFSADMMLLSITFMTAMAIFIQGSNFLYEQKSCSGFIHMLPGNDRDRVVGRYISGAIYLVICSIMQIILLMVKDDRGFDAVNFNLKWIFIGLGVGLIIMAIYSNLMYLVGVDKRNHKSVLFMLPLVLIGGALYVIEPYEMNETVKSSNAFVNFLKDNITRVTIGIVILGIIIYLLSICLSVKIITKKDYA